MENKRQIFEFYNKIIIPKKVQGYIYDNDNEIIKYISGFSKINIFIGTNNSGKSLLLREILKEEEINNFPNNELRTEINNFINEKKKNIKHILKENNIHSLVYNNNIKLSESIIDEKFSTISNEFKSTNHYFKKILDELNDLVNFKPNYYKNALARNATYQLDQSY